MMKLSLLFAFFICWISACQAHSAHLFRSNKNDDTQINKDTTIHARNYHLKERETAEVPSVTATLQLQVDCPGQLINHLEYVFVYMYNATPELITKEDVFVLETNFEDLYNRHTYENCDSFFRKISFATLLPSYHTTLPSIFVLQVECRDCIPPNSTEPFPLFDGSSRRQRRSLIFPSSSSKSSWTSTVIHNSDHPVRRSLQSDICTCPTDQEPIIPTAPSKNDFLERYNNVINELHRLGFITTIDSIGSLEEHELACDNKNLNQVIQNYAIRFVGTDTGIIEDSILQSAFVSAFNILRTEICSPLLAFATVLSRKTEVVEDTVVQVESVFTDVEFDVISLQTFSFSYDLFFNNTLFASEQVREVFLQEYNDALSSANFTARAIWVFLRDGLGATARNSSSMPSMIPSQEPSFEPSIEPSEDPSMEPSQEPSHEPSIVPSFSVFPSQQPSVSTFPSQQPSLSSLPSNTPSQASESTAVPSLFPSLSPSHSPTLHPSSASSLRPSSIPSMLPSSHPTSNPTFNPTSNPTDSPSEKPSERMPRVTLPLRSDPPTISPTTTGQRKE